MATGFSVSTARLQLRDYQSGDLAVVREVFLDPALARHHLLGQASEDYVREHFACGRMQTRWHPRLAYDLAIVSATGETLGLCGLKRDQQRLESGQLNWHICPAHWHQGYATEAATCLLEFGFTELQLAVITASAFAGNAASIRVMEKIGLRSTHNNATATWWRGVTYGEPRPIVGYALSKEEWLADRLCPAINQPFVCLKLRSYRLPTTRSVCTWVYG